MQIKPISSSCSDIETVEPLYKGEAIYPSKLLYGDRFYVNIFRIKIEEGLALPQVAHEQLWTQSGLNWTRDPQLD